MYEMSCTEIALHLKPVCTDQALQFYFHFFTSPAFG